MGVASLVLGIVGLVLAFVPCVGWIALALTIPGIILGAVGIAKASKHEGQGKGVSIGGLVCSLLATAIAIFWITCMAKGASELAGVVKEAHEEVKKQQTEASSKGIPSSYSELKDIERKVKEIDNDAKKLQQQGMDIIKGLSN